MAAAAPCPTRRAVTLTRRARLGAAGHLLRKQRHFGDGSPSDNHPKPTAVPHVSLCTAGQEFSELMPGFLRSWWREDRGSAAVPWDVARTFPVNAPPAPLQAFTPSCKPLGLIAAAVLGEAVKAKPWRGGQ